MSKNESLERMAGEILEEQLVDMLEQYHITNWKQVGLEAITKYAQRQKEYGENSNNTHLMNEMIKIIEIIEIAETLAKTKRIS